MQKRHTCAAFFFMRESEAKLSPFWRKSQEKEKKNCIPHKPRDLTQFKGEISCKKEGQNLTFFHTKSEAMQQISKKVILMRKKKEEEKSS